MEAKSIRENILKQNLIPVGAEGNEITVGGKIIKAPPSSKASAKQKPLLSVQDFVSAVTKLVEEVRQFDEQDISDHTASVNVIESCRQISIEARVVVYQAFGEGSEEVKLIESALQNVFMLGSAKTSPASE